MNSYDHKERVNAGFSTFSLLRLKIKMGMVNTLIGLMRWAGLVLLVLAVFAAMCLTAA